MKRILYFTVAMICLLIAVMCLSTAAQTEEVSAKVTTSDGFGVTLSKGKPVWSNRQQHVMNTYPELLDGKNFIYSMINASYTITVKQPGVIYIMTTELAKSQYTSIGFSQLKDIATFKMHSAFSDPTIILKKEYTQNDISQNATIVVNENSLGAEWAVVFADCIEPETLSGMAKIITDDTGVLSSMRPGSKLISDRTYVLGQIPSWISEAGNVFFVCGNNAWKSTAVADSDGKIYAIAFNTKTEDKLKAAGFTKASDYPTFRIAPGVAPDTEKDFLYVKSVKKGDSVSIDIYCAIFMGINETEDERDSALKAPRVYTMNTADGKAELENAASGYKDGTRKWQGIPGIGRAEINGRLWATWYSGGTGECKDNYVILTTSTDNGNTWSDARVIIDPDKEGYVRAFDPVLWTDPNGKLWVFWNQEFTYSAAWSGTDGRMGVWGMYTENPDAENPTWSTPVRLCNNVVMNKPLVTKSGEWLLCAYMINGASNDQTDPSELGPCLYRFTGYDKAWEKWSQIDKNAFSFPDAFCEHMAVENSDGSITVVIRTTQGIYTTTTQDNGKTWTKAAILTNNGKPVSKTNSRPFIMTLSSGAQMLIYHDTTSDVRNNLKVALSYDSGKTWTKSMMIDVRTGVSYPDAVQAADGTIYITYDYDRYGEKAIMLARLKQSDIEAGKITANDSKLGLVINSNGRAILDDYYRIDGVDGLSGTLAMIEAVDNTGIPSVLEKEAKLFMDRDYVIVKIPEVFHDTCYIASNIDAGQSGNAKTQIKVLSGGYVYALTPAQGEKCSQISQLEAMGFAVDTAFGSLTQLFSNQAELLCVMKKQAEKGETFEASKYVVFIGDSCTLFPTHHITQKDEAKAATCTESGLTEGSHCAVCEAVITAQEEIKAEGHTWDEGMVTKEPTATEDGVKTYRCEKCNDTKTENIPHTMGPTDPPYTGDKDSKNNSILLIVLSAATALAGFAALILLRKRRYR